MIHYFPFRFSSKSTFAQLLGDFLNLRQLKSRLTFHLGDIQRAICFLSILSWNFSYFFYPNSSVYSFTLETLSATISHRSSPDTNPYQFKIYCQVNLLVGWEGQSPQFGGLVHDLPKQPTNVVLSLPNLRPSMNIRQY